MIGDIFLKVPFNQLLDQLQILHQLLDVLYKGFSVPYLMLIIAQIPLLEDVSVGKALLQAPIQHLYELSPLHEDLVLKALRQDLLDLGGDFGVPEAVQDLVLSLKAGDQR